ncbi:hypothetical protein, partial [Micromonospora parathelypteridis]|uniref:hypothetical protein n=1 Tax=Micromonospora parathelypteridis TaxID=1839617 RepID=UPI0016699633
FCFSASVESARTAQLLRRSPRPLRPLVADQAAQQAIDGIRAASPSPRAGLTVMPLHVAPAR